MTDQATSANRQQSDSNPHAAQQNGKDNHIPGFTFWMNDNGHMLENWTKSSSTLMKKNLKITEDVLSFSQTRLQANIETLKKLSSCLGLRDVLECQKQFAEKTTSHYAEEMSKLTAQLMSAMSDASVLLRQEPSVKS
jgi:hypothetical protein